MEVEAEKTQPWLVDVDISLYMGWSGCDYKRAIKELKNGKNFSCNAERWSSAIYRFKLHDNCNHKFSDGRSMSMTYGHQNYEVRTTPQFAPSKFLGSGRPKITMPQLMGSLEDKSLYIYVHKINLPKIIFYPIKTNYAKSILIEVNKKNTHIDMYAETSSDDGIDNVKTLFTEPEFMSIFVKKHQLFLEPKEIKFSELLTMVRENNKEQDRQEVLKDQKIDLFDDQT